MIKALARRLTRLVVQWEQTQGIVRETPEVVRGRLVAHLATLRTCYERARTSIPGFHAEPVRAASTVLWPPGARRRRTTPALHEDWVMI